VQVLDVAVVAATAKVLRSPAVNALALQVDEVPTLDDISGRREGPRHTLGREVQLALALGAHVLPLADDTLLFLGRLPTARTWAELAGRSLAWRESGTLHGSLFTAAMQ